MFFHPQKRSIKWRVKLGTKGIFSSALKISADHLFVATLDGTYALLNSKDGCKVWSHQLKSPVFSTGVQIKQFNCIAVAEVRGQIFVCDIKDGKKVSSIITVYI